MKLKRLLAIALSVAVMFTIGAASAVLAVEKDAATADQIDTPEAAKLVKYLKKAEGTTNPTATYKFQFAPIDKTTITTTVGDKTTTHDTVPAADFPKKGDSSTFVYEMASTDVATDAGIEGTGDVKGSANIATIFNGVTFVHAGEYLYNVSELAPTFTAQSGDVTDSLTKDSQEFTLHLYVVNDGNGTKIDKVTVEKGDTGEKVDPSDDNVTPGSGESRDDANYKADGFTFTNTYTKTIKKHENPEPEDPDNPDMINGAFQLDKTVTGQYGDKTKKFEFTVTVVLPKGESFAYAEKMTGATTDVSFNESGVATVKLADPDSFGFSELPVGTKITVTEADYTGNGYKAPTWTYGKNTTVTESTLLVGEKGASAVATNECKDDEVTPTGILINNLPYILLILLAAGGIVVFARKRRYQ